MLIESGRVVALDKNGLWVETIRRSTCGSCAVQKGCGHGLMNRLGDGRRSYVRVLPGDIPLEHCAVDDEVEIGIPEDVLLRGSLLVYIMPLAVMLLGAACGSQVGTGDGDLMAAAGAVVGFCLGIGAVRSHAWLHRNDPRLQPTLVGIQSTQVRPLGLA